MILAEVLGEKERSLYNVVLTTNPTGGAAVRGRRLTA